MAPATTLSARRLWAALGVAIAADLVQLGLGPLGWTFLDEVIDVATAGVEIGLLGFHPLFLPTLVVEFIPMIDMLPTWTGCVVAVIALRRKSARASRPPEVIDV